MPTAPAIAFKKFIPAIIWFVIVLGLICMPGDDLPKVDNWFKKIYGDKLVHVGIFALLAYLFFLPISRTSYSRAEKLNFLIRIAIATCVWGLATEAIQGLFIPSRSFDLRDWLANSIGALAAYIWGRWKMI